MIMRKNRRAYWFGAAFAAALLIPIWIYLNVLQNTYATRPHEPDPARGWTVPYAGKGGTVYVTPQGHETVIWLFRIDFGLILVIAFCGFMAAGGLGRRTRKPD
ncbi:MAG TPA: hypothetical protein VMU87_13505 [Stellaceae bacterium]|nr:hypothetical protein [Stellaceae bacterium]